MAKINRLFIDHEEICEVIDMDPKDILRDPLLNKGTAFTEEEREILGIHGFLPYHTSTIEEQVKRRYENFCRQKTPIDKYLFLTALQDCNETLFYRFISEHVEEMLPYIYTPTVGDASTQYSSIYHQNRGVYFSYPHRNQIKQMVANIPKEDVEVIVVTDGGRILGLGDLGIGGMAIPIGKLSLYTLFGGIHPAKTLPVLLDVGTDNLSLLNDPLYLGWKHERIKGKKYLEFIGMFIEAIKERYPHVVVQWEDFSKENAQPILDCFRSTICSFNDDIQGTASVVTGAILAALQGIDSDLKEQRIVIFGAGSAGIGIARLITLAMSEKGMSLEDAKKRIFVLGRNGLAHSQSEKLDHLKKNFAQKYEDIQHWAVENFQNITLLETVSHARPTILIGTSTKPGSFSKEIVYEMKKHVARPIIFPLSNPTSKSEAIPMDMMNWTKGQALIATGSPFSPIEYEGKQFMIGQCNNFFIFPGIGMGAVLSKAKMITDEMFLIAAKVLSSFAPILNHPFASLLPSVKQINPISKKIAIAVAKEAINQGITREKGDLSVENRVKKFFWTPNYAKFKEKRALLFHNQVLETPQK